MKSNNSVLPVTTILFDMDNTLFDLVGAQIAACNHVVSYLGHDDGDALFSYFLESVHGFESPENIRQYMNDRQIPVDGLFEEACRIYHTEKLRSIMPYAGVRETLQVIQERGLRMGIVTDAQKNDAVQRLEKCAIYSLFDCLITFDTLNIKKPAHEPFLAALSAMKCSVQKTLFIGDSPRRDIEPCRALGIRTIYARYGDRFSKNRDGAGADYSIDAMDELLDIIDRIPSFG